jgi:hypothetical protein
MKLVYIFLPISVESSDDGDDLVFACKDPAVSEESLEVCVVDIAVVPVVNAFEGCLEGVVIGTLEVPLQVLGFQVEFDFPDEQLREGFLHAHRQVV